MWSGSGPREGLKAQKKARQGYAASSPNSMASTATSYLITQVSGCGKARSSTAVGKCGSRPLRRCASAVHIDAGDAPTHDGFDARIAALTQAELDASAVGGGREERGRQGDRA
jgi:hypothetical protein